jgi:5'-nucleotidase
MNAKRPTILITNDDGIHAPGISCLWRALHAADIANLVIIAPSTERSGTGVSITWDRPILIQEIPWPNATPAWSIDGTPADCVKMGLRLLLQAKPDYIFSGINAGSNAGRNVLHSGTLGAVIEGVLRGIPGVGISCENEASPNFPLAEKYIGTIVEYLRRHPLPSGCLLNINFPDLNSTHVKGFCLTRQGRGRWAEDPYLHLDTEHGPSYWLGGKPEEISEDASSDIALLRQGYMTAVPLFMHDFTDQKELEARSHSFETFFSQHSN